MVALITVVDSFDASRSNWSSR